MPEQIKPATLLVKLAGPHSWPRWVTSLCLILRLTKVGVGEKRAWDIVDRTYKKPGKVIVKVESCKSTATETTSPSDGTQAWDNANDFALITILHNCEDDIRSHIETYKLAKDAYNGLKKSFEGNMAIQYYFLLSSVNNFPFDDRTTTINEHITTFENK